MRAEEGPDARVVRGFQHVQGAVEEFFSPVDHDQPVRNAIGRVEVVRDHHLREVLRFLQPANQLADQVGVDRVQSCCRFIIQD